MIVFPVSIIGDLVVGIVKNSLSAHFVFLPFTYVLSSLIIVEYSLSVTHVIEFSAFISSSEVGFGHVFKLVLFADSAGGVS